MSLLALCAFRSLTFIGVSVLLRLLVISDEDVPRRMPCEKNNQVAGTLIPQESHTLHFNQLFNEEMK
ncbi:hypothetical protein UN64_04020 [Fictibacillus arsenicus]|uniref:Uncharacterized protein n=1 Tax=Fictibacillus arsenicus TaxID=255247 RepID=A0A1V3GBX0_9BACL|nr:hypothetical protein UN64_04020 [Fictibacillus arsenicus]